MESSTRRNHWMKQSRTFPKSTTKCSRIETGKYQQTVSHRNSKHRSNTKKAQNQQQNNTKSVCVQRPDFRRLNRKYNNKKLENGQIWNDKQCHGYLLKRGWR